MIKPEQFKLAANEALAGLTAGPALLNRARIKASGPAPIKPQRRMHRALAMAMSLVLVIGLSALVLPRLLKPQIPVLDTLAAGSDLAPSFRITADLPRGSLVLTKGNNPGYQGVWEPGNGANFPLVRVDGRYYRLLTHPQDVSALAGPVLGSVAVFTLEPALDNSSELLSNVAAMDAPVQEVSGMGKAAVAAQVNGQARLFQRVSFAGNALIGSEGLKDTLPSGAQTMQLSEVGTVSDTDAVERLMDILHTKAVYQGSQSRSGSQALLVQYANGVVLQLSVNGDSLSACGTWACPEFFEAFRAAAQ